VFESLAVIVEFDKKEKKKISTPHPFADTKSHLSVVLVKNNRNEQVKSRKNFLIKN